MTYNFDNSDDLMIIVTNIRSTVKCEKSSDLQLILHSVSYRYIPQMNVLGIHKLISSMLKYNTSKLKLINLDL